MRRVLLLAVSALFAFGCHSSTSPSGQSEAFDGNIGPLGTSTPITITASKAGTLTLTVTWTPTTVTGGALTDEDLYLTSTSCTATNPLFSSAAACAFIASARNVNTSSETLTKTVVQGDTFKAWVDNFSNVSITFHLTDSIP